MGECIIARRGGKSEGKYAYLSIPKVFIRNPENDTVNPGIVLNTFSAITMYYSDNIRDVILLSPNTASYNTSSVPHSVRICSVGPNTNWAQTVVHNQSSPTPDAYKLVNKYVMGNWGGIGTLSYITSNNSNDYNIILSGFRMVLDTSKCTIIVSNTRDVVDYADKPDRFLLEIDTSLAMTIRTG